MLPTLRADFNVSIDSRMLAAIDEWLTNARVPDAIARFAAGGDHFNAPK